MFLKRTIRLALASIKQSRRTVEFVADNGYLKTLWDLSPEGLFNEALITSNTTQNPYALHARRFLRQIHIKQLLQLDDIRLRLCKVTDLGELGFMVMYKQIRQFGHAVRDGRRSHLQIYIRPDGVIWLVQSSLKYGDFESPRRIIARDKAIEIAKQDFGSAETALKRCRLVVASLRRSNQLVYEVTLRCRVTRKRTEYLVEAGSGKILHREELSLFHSAPCNVFALIPDPLANRPFAVQSSSFSNLVDATMFKTDQVQVFFKNEQFKLVELRPLADGTYSYKQDQREFEAVNAAFWINSLLKVFEECGGKKLPKILVVRICDDGFPNNAEFDPSRFLIDIGRGTGRKGGGYTPDEGNDGTFPAHELGHCFVFILAPAGWLPGLEGRALNECLGDVAALMMSYLLRIWFGPRSGKLFTKQDLINDPRVIGPYTSHPQLRELKTVLTMKDKNGKIHHDGLIPGGALLDLMIWFATARTSVAAELSESAEMEMGMRDFFRLLITALTLMPSDNVLFTDAARCFVLADKKVFDGAHTEAIRKCFGNHGITV